VAQRLVPFLGYEDAAAAIDWLSGAFGAVENRESRHEENGRITHAEIDLEGAIVYLSTPDDYVSSKRHRETCEAAHAMYDNPWVIDGHFVEVADVEAHAARAREHGATILRGPEEPGTGFRIYTVEDVEGHRWMFGQRL